MNRIAGIVLAGTVLVAGCATGSGARSKEEPTALDTRVESLETQLTALNQRVDQLSAEQQASDADSGSPAGASSAGFTKPAARKSLSVRQIQQALSSAGFYGGPMDGKEGPKTRKAVREFQQAKGLKADGVVGSETRAAMSRYLTES